MGMIKNLFEKIKRYITDEPQAETTPDRITIKEHYDHHLSNLDINSENKPKISIKRINQRTPIASGTINGREVDVPKRKLKGGITVNKLCKPNICPICRTPGKIIKNADTGASWKCNECGSIFN